MFDVQRLIKIATYRSIKRYNPEPRDACRRLSSTDVTAGTVEDVVIVTFSPIIQSYMHGLL